MLGPRWTQSIPKAGEKPEEGEDGDEPAEVDDDAEVREAAAPDPVADTDTRSELPSGARKALDDEALRLGSRGKPEPSPRYRPGARHTARPAPAPPEAKPIWKPEPAEQPKSAEPISNARSREVDPDSAYAKPTPVPRRDRPSRISRARVASAQRIPRRSSSGEGQEPVARSLGLGNKIRERDTFEVASMVFGAIIAFFGLWGAIATIGGGLGSAGFVISVIFFLLGVGRLYMGFRGHKPVAEAHEPLTGD